MLELIYSKTCRYRLIVSSKVECLLLRYPIVALGYTCALIYINLRCLKASESSQRNYDDTLMLPETRFEVLPEFSLWLKSRLQNVHRKCQYHHHTSRDAKCTLDILLRHRPRYPERDAGEKSREPQPPELGPMQAFGKVDAPS